MQERQTGNLPSDFWCCLSLYWMLLLCLPFSEGTVLTATSFRISAKFITQRIHQRFVEMGSPRSLLFIHFTLALANRTTVNLVNTYFFTLSIKLRISTFSKPERVPDIPKCFEHYITFNLRVLKWNEILEKNISVLEVKISELKDIPEFL